MTTTIIIAVSDAITLLFLLLNMKDILVLQIYPPFLKQRTISVFGLQLLRFYEFSFLTSFSNPYHRLLCHSLHRSVILFIFLSMENIQSSKKHSHKQLFTIHHWPSRYIIVDFLNSILEWFTSVGILPPT